MLIDTHILFIHHLILFIMTWEDIKDSVSFRYSNFSEGIRLCLYKDKVVGEYSACGGGRFLLTLYKPDGSVFYRRVHSSIDDAIDAIAIYIFVSINTQALPDFAE